MLTHRAPVEAAPEFGEAPTPVVRDLPLDLNEAPQVQQPLGGDSSSLDHVGGQGLDPGHRHHGVLVLSQAVLESHQGLDVVRQGIFAGRGVGEGFSKKLGGVPQTLEENPQAVEIGGR
jgi:hypothetical protein